jgi:hypothetical protein
MEQGDFIVWEQIRKGVHTIRIGIIMSIEEGTKARIFFEGMNSPLVVLVRRLAPTKPPKPLRMLLREGAEAVEQAALKKSERTITPYEAQRHWDSLVERFLEKYPGGFNDEAFHTGERSWRIEASFAFNDAMPDSNIRALLESESHNELARMALKAIPSKTGLLSSPQDRQRLKRLADGMPEEFAQALHDLLCEPPQDAPFNRFSEVLAAGESATWPVATVFPFLRNCTKCVLVKPRHVEKMARAMCKRFKCSHMPSWQGYMKILDIMSDVRRRLDTRHEVYLHPRDMLDVQSFVATACRIRRRRRDTDGSGGPARANASS